MAVFVYRFADDVRDVYAKKLPMKSQRKAIVDNSCRTCRYEKLEGYFLIVPNHQIFVSIVCREIEEKVPLKPPASSPLTISCVSSTECQIFFFYVENVLGTSETRVIFNPPVVSHLCVSIEEWLIRNPGV